MMLYTVTSVHPHLQWRDSKDIQVKINGIITKKKLKRDGEWLTQNLFELNVHKRKAT